MSSELDIAVISHDNQGFEEELKKLRENVCKAATFNPRSQEGQKVAKIIDDVEERRDEAVTEYTQAFDGVTLSPEKFRISDEELSAAHAAVDAVLLAAIRKAIDNVKRYQTKIFVGNQSQFSDGTGIKYTPIRRVGVCVPGASAPLPSTVIMTVVPAQVAGVREIAVVSPPRHEGSVHPVILAVCRELGVREVYRIGGVQAVGALAYGTPSVPKVDMIVGPGNSWVQAAKKQVAGDTVGIDSIAGPSEVFIIAGAEANPAWVAADMLSQAEHAADSSAVVATDSESLARAILQQLSEQLAVLPRADDARESLRRFSRVIVVESIDDAVALADEFASEHLEIQCGSRSREVAERIRNAGAIFIGPHTPVAVGDYWAGPSHTLPTGSRARFSSAVTSNDFVKSISLIEYSADQLAACADDIVRLAQVEGLDAHARSVQIRQQD